MSPVLTGDQARVAFRRLSEIQRQFGQRDYPFDPDGALAALQAVSEGRFLVSGTTPSWESLLRECNQEAVHRDFNPVNFPIEPFAFDENEWEVCVHHLEGELSGEEAFYQLQKLGFRLLSGSRRAMQFLAAHLGYQMSNTVVMTTRWKDHSGDWFVPVFHRALCRGLADFEYQKTDPKPCIDLRKFSRKFNSCLWVVLKRKSFAEYFPIIDCCATPFLPSGWTIHPEDQVRGTVNGQFKLDPFKVDFYLTSEQKIGTVIPGDKLAHVLDNLPVLPAQALDYFLAHQEVIPAWWRKGERGCLHHIYFWGTIYRDSEGRRRVSCMYWEKNVGQWREYSRLIDNKPYNVWCIQESAALYSV